MLRRCGNPSHDHEYDTLVVMSVTMVLQFGRNEVNQTTPTRPRELFSSGGTFSTSLYGLLEHDTFVLF